MQHSVEPKSAFVSQMKLMLMILYYGWLVSSIRSVLVNVFFSISIYLLNLSQQDI